MAEASLEAVQAARSEAMTSAIQELAKVKAETDIQRNLKAVELAGVQQAISAAQSELAELNAQIRSAQSLHNQVVESIASLRKQLGG